MRVLVACEFSGVVRRAFRALGHDAWSCDLLPSEDNSPHHIEGDAFSFYALGARAKDWDLLIAHPPCTYLCNSGVRWLAPGGVVEPHRHEQMKEAADFFAKLYSCEVPRVAVENPVMHKYARDYLQETWRCLRQDARPTQTFQPWQHGEGEVKRTCLWLRGLPQLVPSAVVEGRTARVHRASPGPDRWKERSRTLPGIAAAMATQWGAAPLPRRA